MKSILTVNGRGDIALPVEMRQAMGLKADDTLIAELTPDGILLRPAMTGPIEIYTPKRLREFDAAEQDLAKVLSKKTRRTR
jgi:bifunctional DNA-binding transcriptional regulator/antitoxin component of YhaV-PrlF toxin-antitoxin module